MDIHEIIPIAIKYGGHIRENKTIDNAHWLTIDFPYATSVRLFGWEMEKMGYQYKINECYSKPQIEVQAKRRRKWPGGKELRYSPQYVLKL